LQSTRSEAEATTELSSAAEDDVGDDDSGSKRKEKRKHGKDTRREEREEDQVCFDVLARYFGLTSVLSLSWRNKKHRPLPVLQVDLMAM
jgi:hypothetical protein